MKGTVLIVDDDRLEAELLMRALRKAGCQGQLLSFTNTDEAKRYLRGRREYGDRTRFPIPALVILDHRMPGDNGWDVLRWIRQDDSLREVHAVVFSGSGAPDEQAKAEELRAAYQVKPRSFEEYEAVVRRMAEFWLSDGGGSC